MLISPIVPGMRVEEFTSIIFILYIPFRVLKKNFRFLKKMRKKLKKNWKPFEKRSEQNVHQYKLQD